MLKMVMFIILAVLAGLFIFQNTHIAEVYFLKWNTKLSTSLLLLITLIIGTVLGWLGSKAKKKK
ncbi:MAG: DUF1049 domain-containing protein [Nitrospirae bacterium]|nr:DUF1049 domain-containing protein [Nitrospirota bacterium]